MNDEPEIVEDVMDEPDYDYIECDTPLHCIDVDHWNALERILKELVAEHYIDHDEYGSHWCLYCGSHWKEEEQHTEECPIKQGKQLLEGLD